MMKNRIFNFFLTKGVSFSSVIILCVGFGISNAASFSVWAVDCRLLVSSLTDQERSRILSDIGVSEDKPFFMWFAMDEETTDKSPLQFCHGWRCIPYPGFWEYFDLKNDPRIKWISDNQIEVSNSDKDVGWEGFKQFNRCEL